MVLGYLFQIFKLFIIISNISFYIGMFWLIFCDVTYDLFADNHNFASNEWFMTQLKNKP